MSFLFTFKTVLAALKRENELSLAYLYGQKLDQLDHLKNRKFRFSGLFFRFFNFIRFIRVNSTVWSKPLGKTDVLFFASTDNQFNSLTSTVESFEKIGGCYSVLLTRSVGKKNFSKFNNTIKVRFSFSVVLEALALFVIKAPLLYWSLKKQKRAIEIKKYFNVFCQSYAYLPYFLKVLNSSNPSLVVMSNDHNVNNRSLRLAAEVLGIQTLYMQHASVSELFPPLEYDYALLDGQEALETYSHCFQFYDGGDERVIANVRKCQVVLTGQKKIVSISNNTNKPTCLAGIAVNTLDDFEIVETVLHRFVQQGEECLVRTHTLQSVDFVKKLKNFTEIYPGVKWSDSRKESLADFFGRISCVIAGNTSLHLEAALAGLATFYLEMSHEVHIPDYYGYVKKGVSVSLASDFSISELKSKIALVNHKDRTIAIKKYSETYGTEWQNREGELSASVIEKVLKEKDLGAVFNCEETSIYRSIFSLKKGLR